MKYLEDLRNKHKGEEIWVIGAGPSLDDYPIDFFEDKICLCVNMVCSVFIDIGDGIEKFKSRVFYSVSSHDEGPRWVVRHVPQQLKNFFLIYHPPHKKRPRRSYCCPEDFNEDPYWIRNSFGVQKTRASDATFAAMAKCIMTERNDCSYFCRGTTLHWAISVAAVLGAKKIYLVGAEAKGGHMKKHGSLYTYKQVIGFISTWHSGVKSLAAVFKSYGIEIVYYYYGKGEQKP